jgi:hypothetical protein
MTPGGARVIVSSAMKATQAPTGHPTGARTRESTVTRRRRFAPGRHANRRPMAGVDVTAERVTRALGHVVEWAKYQMADPAEPSGCPARLSYYRSPAPAHHSVAGRRAA